MRGTSVARTTNLATVNANNVAIFDSAEYDDDGLWSLADPTKIGPLPGSYAGLRGVLSASAIWDSAASGYRELKVFRNGDKLAPIAVVQLERATYNTGLELTSRPIVLAADDWFELCCRSLNASTALAASDYSIRFALEVRE